MINDQNGSSLTLGWSPSFASCCVWNSMLCYASCLSKVLIGSVPRHGQTSQRSFASHWCWFWWQRIFGTRRFFWRIACMFNQLVEHVFFRFTPRVERVICETHQKIPHLFITTGPTTSAASQNSVEKNWTKGAYANNQHQLNAEIKENPRKTSFYRAIKLCVGVLLILDSDATPFTRSLGKKTPSKLKGVQVAITNCQRSDLHQCFNKVSNSNFHRFMTVS